MKDLRKRNKMLYSISKKSVSRLEMKISRRSRLSLLRSATILAANFPETNHIMTPIYPEILTEINIDSLMDVWI